MADTDRTFEYLLNAMERAAQAKYPAKAGYGHKRQAVLDHVANLTASAEKSAARVRVLEVQKQNQDAVLDWIDRNAQHELRIRASQSGHVQVDRWHRRYVSYFAHVGINGIREAVRRFIDADGQEEQA